MIPDGPFLLCEIGDDRIAIEAAKVREILPVLPLWRPPTLPRPLAGFIRVRGEVLPVLAPAILFGAPDGGAVDAFAHIVRTRDEAPASLCLLVDRAEDLVAPDPAAIRPIEAGASQNGAFVAELDVDAGMAHLLSLDRLLDESERVRIAALAEERSTAFRRLNLVRGAVRAISDAEEPETAVARARFVVAQSLGWDEIGPPQERVLDRHLPFLEALRSGLADAGGQGLDAAEAALRDFEAWYRAETGSDFYALFERYMPETPRVDF